MAEERKLVSILFADVTGSTALGDALDPEDVRTLMGRYYAIAREVIPAHGGTLEKFIGDAIMAIFGLPKALGDDAERALAAALALRERVANDELLGPVFQLRIGVNTGEVIATSDPSSGEFLATGDAVNVAARLQQHTNPDEIVVGERTWKATEHAFCFEQPRMAEVKGKPRPIALYPLIGPRATRKQERPPLVGRKQDLMQLALLWERVLEEERPQLVSIMAPAGTGKSRLLEEFLDTLGTEAEYHVAVARCLPYGQQIAYFPLRGLLAQLLGAESKMTREYISSLFVAAGYQQTDAERSAEVILSTLGIEGEKSSDRESIFSAWRLLIEVLSRATPLILVFEDLHWSSNSLLDLVDSLTAMRTNTPLLLLTLSRPELLDRRPNWGGGRQNFTSLALRPLSARQTRELIRKQAAELDPEVMAQIVDRAGGNPFFALELIRGLKERGLTEKKAALNQLPDTVHSAILARMDQLQPQERAILQVAAVAGRGFTLPMLAEALSEYSLHEIAAALVELLERDIIEHTEKNAYTFQHVLFCNVAYKTLSRTQRVCLHERIAASLEAVAGERLDEQVEMIAYHYQEAIRLSRQSAVRMPLTLDVPKALRILRRAARQANQIGEVEEVNAYLQSAISIAPESELISLYEQLGDSLGFALATKEAYQKALEYWEKSKQAQGEDPDFLRTGARLLRKLIIYYERGSGNEIYGIEELPQWRERAQVLAEQAGDQDELHYLAICDGFFISVLSNLARPLPQDIEERVQRLQEACSYFEQKGDQEALNIALDALISHYVRFGSVEKAVPLAQKRLQISGLPASERADAWQMLIRSYVVQGNYPASVQALEQAFGELLPGQTPTYLVSSIRTVIEAAFERGRWDDVERWFAVIESVYLPFFSDEAYDPSLAHLVGIGSYLTALQIALLQEDQARCERYIPLLKRFGELLAEQKKVLDAELSLLLDGELPEELKELYHTHLFVTIEGMKVYNQRGEAQPSRILETLSNDGRIDRKMRAHLDLNQALLERDYERANELVTQLECLGRVVFAAHMKIVLAELTGDLTRLTGVRPLLEGLKDRVFLRRLEALEAA
ncbi:AAA ATPase-like protein [Thermosporothrix hazakensis]|uniref:AAA ATPase-like protein n=1 Tax=Thermosporothrix hazakensis TaxID=644383 RepID=A0A326UFJ1_THEHA|nr:adenylate/guanylate cyclase domain-containing protein [Thermosporothrix hazakensis]PZW29373.1 AAA ATPase-like protein [Thermosporothrix hazakensis]GCE45913.1 hypothetical protein KTH_07820 [Thermosporothrix hazakensis]